MMNFVARALEKETPKIEDEWCRLVQKNWSMQCAFDTGVERQLLTASWFMGDVRFEVADLSGQQWIWKPGPGLDSWRRNTIVVFLTESGSTEIEQNGKSVRLKSNSCLLLDGSVKYAQASGPDSRGLLLRVPKASLETRGKISLGRDLLLVNNASPDVLMLQSMLTGAAAYGEASSVYTRWRVAELLTHLMGEIADELAAPNGRTRPEMMLRKVKRFIERNAGNENIDLDFVAGAMGVSKRHLSRIFAQEGTSVMRYLLQQRLAKAEKILAHSDESVRISDVAWHCGFVSAAHFSRAFKRQYGVSPTTLQCAEQETVK
jgi:AraC-like DNA-binding protein